MSPRLLVLSGMLIFASGCGSSSPAAVAPEPITQPEKVQAETSPAPTTGLPPLPEKAAPASFENLPTTKPASLANVELAKPTTTPSTEALAVFDQQLAKLIADQPLTTPTSGLTPDNRVLIDCVVNALASFRMTLRDGSSLMSRKTAPFTDLSDSIHEQIPLALPTLALCKTVTQFGVYEPIEPARFTAGKASAAIIYCEVEHFRSALTTEQHWETKLSYEATLYRDGEAAVSVISKKPTAIVDRCRNKRRDFFLADRLTLPATLPMGKYMLKVTVIDQLANHVAENTAPVLIAPE